MATNRKMKRGAAKTAFVVLVCGQATIGTLSAAELENPEPQPSRFGRVGQQLSDWNVILGAGVMFGPKYEGSDEFKATPIPFVSMTFFDALTIDPRGAPITAFEQGPFELDLLVGYELGRKEDDADHLKGLGDVDFGITAGAKASVHLGPADLFAQVDKTFEGSDGLVGRLGVEVTQPLSQSWLVSASASAVFADRRHMEAYFGVTSEQAARSGLPAYEIGAGLKRADFSISATYLVDQNWIVRGEAQLGLLLGDAADSPVVVEKLQPSVMLHAGYRF